MISNMEVKAVHFDINDRLKKYVVRKIGRLDRLTPRNSRSVLHCTVVLTENEGKAKNRFTCEATLTLPHEVITAKEATVNMYAAIDIAEAKLKTQLLKYKSQETNYRHRARLFLRRVGRFRRRQDKF